MAFVLGHNQYGKAENRVVRVFRDTDPHELVDYNVSVALSGGQEAPHLTGDNSPVLPTDTQKNTVYAFAKEDEVVAQPESFGTRLARHFVDDTEPITRARVKLEMYPWSRLNNPHAFVRDGRHVRTATVTYDGTTTWVVSGVKDLVLLKTTDSEFWGFLRDRYTTLPPTTDRVMATSLLAQCGSLTEYGAEHIGAYELGRCGAEYGAGEQCVGPALASERQRLASLARLQRIFIVVERQQGGSSSNRTRPCEAPRITTTA